ncbi:hypothetical protein [Thiomicrospira sp.]|uniref:hypothetical protein n=1 Tax=Thiomicrospira sp. TaxID=935 RepID=UPI002F952249
MADYVMFQMWSDYRQYLIDSHMFYFDQANSRLLSQFQNIDDEAKAEADKWLEDNQHRFDPERHDPSDFYEKALDLGCSFYEMLSDMEERTRLSVLAGMFHEWDKQLRVWLSKEVNHWHRGENTKLQIWKKDFPKVMDLLESFGWDIKSTDFHQKLDACRLIVNVYKHGNGGSFNDLKQNYPQYLESGINTLNPFTGVNHDYRDYSYLKITDADIQEMSDAIIEFWQNVPENVFQSQFTSPPQWFFDAIQRDNSN